MGELTATAMVAEAKSRIENLTPEDVAKEIAGGALMVDIRDEEELRSAGRIPDAVSAPRGMLEFYVDPTSAYHREEFQPDRRIILYCASGGRSALGADTMQRMGYSQVAHLDGGFTAWKEQGRPIEHDA